MISASTCAPADIAHKVDALAHTYPALTKLPDDFGMRLFRVESDIIVQAMLQLLEVK